MAISNIQETLLMYTKQKAMLNYKLSSVMSTMLSAARQTADKQAQYNAKEANIYYTYYATDPDTYYVYLEDLQQDRELSMAALNAWETQLESQKNALETSLNYITQTESSWTKLLQSNIKNDFTYGGGQK